MAPVTQDQTAGTPPAGPASATQPATGAPTTDAPPARAIPSPSGPGTPATASAVAMTGNYATARQLLINQPATFDAHIQALQRAKAELESQIQALQNSRDAVRALIAQGL